MGAIVRQAALELRSLLLLRWTLLLPAASGLWMLLHTYSLKPESSQDVNLYASQTHTVLLTLTTAMPLLLGVLLMRRDLLHPSGVWLFRLPLTAWSWVVSKWLGGFLYLSSVPSGDQRGLCRIRLAPSAARSIDAFGDLALLSPV